MDHRQRLKALLVERSLELGDFTLASGERSSYYIDARRSTMSAEGQFLVGHVAHARIRDAGLQPQFVGGLTMGADPIAYAVAHRSWMEGDPLNAFSVRKQAKSHGSGGRVEGGLPSGSPVVVVEDTLTTGGSALAAVSALATMGCPILAVLTLVDREAGGREQLEAAGHELLSLFTARELLETAGVEDLPTPS